MRANKIFWDEKMTKQFFKRYSTKYTSTTKITELLMNDDIPESGSVKWTKADRKTTENLLNDYWSNISRDQEPEHPNSDNARNIICDTVRAFMNKEGLGFSNEDLDTLSST